MIDPNSATWALVKKHCEKRIDEARSWLESEGNSPKKREIAAQRRQIAVLKEVIALEKNRV